MNRTFDTLARSIRGHLAAGEERAVSNLIATVLLVAIAVFIAGSVSVSVNGMVNGQLQIVQQMEAQLVSAMEVACDDAGLTCTFE